MYYVEYYRRCPGISLEEFHRRTTPVFEDWHHASEDELVANLARTWRMGPHPYLLVWRARGIERLDEWNATFGSGKADHVAAALTGALETYAAGFYHELWAAHEPLAGDFYFETFTPWEGALKAYTARAQATGTSVALIGVRAGLLAPEPGGIALLSLPSLSACERLQAGAPSYAREGGLLTPTGSEVL